MPLRMHIIFQDYFNLFSGFRCAFVKFSPLIIYCEKVKNTIFTTAPLKGKLPPSRETRIASRATLFS